MTFRSERVWWWGKWWEMSCTEGPKLECVTGRGAQDSLSSPGAAIRLTNYSCKVWLLAPRSKKTAAFSVSLIKFSLIFTQQVSIKSSAQISAAHWLDLSLPPPVLQNFSHFFFATKERSEKQRGGGRHCMKLHQTITFPSSSPVKHYVGWENHIRYCESQPEISIQHLS